MLSIAIKNNINDISCIHSYILTSDLQNQEPYSSMQNLKYGTPYSDKINLHIYFQKSIRHNSV